MPTSRYAVVWTLLILVLLVACSGGGAAAPQATATPPPPASPVASSTATPVPGSLFPTGITNEPLTVLATQPISNTADVPVAKDQTRIVAQFNHPVVPLTAIEAQQSLTQPLTIQPTVAGAGQWINTSTYAYTPSQDLTVATQYTVTVAPLKDLLGESLAGYSWSFTTASPAIVKTDPADNTIYAGVSQPITVTFNTEMDRASTESRFSVTRQDTGAAAAGNIEWQGTVMRFVPATPLAFNQTYVATLKAGAQDINHAAATTKDATWTFKTTPAPGVLSTTPADGSQNGDVGNGFLIQFASPMNHDSLKVTIVPTITDQSTFWESTKGGTGNDTTARITGGWKPSQAYAVTIGADSVTRYGEKLSKDVVVHFTTAPLAPSLFLNVPSELGMYDANGSQQIVATETNVKEIDYKLYAVSRTDLLGLIGVKFFQSLQNYTPTSANLLRGWAVTPQAPLNATSLVSTTLTTDGSPLPSGVYFLQATAPGVKNVAKHLLVVSGLNLALKRTETNALVWVTDLKSGKPVANQPLTLYGPTGARLASGQSDADGVFRATFAQVNAFDPVYALSETNGQVVAAVGSDWNAGIATWDFNLPTQLQAQHYYANVYTDRSVYRPGQTVDFKGILRIDHDGQYSLPTDVTAVPVTVTDDQGKQIYKQSLPLDRFGTFSGQLVLSDAASIGYYNLSIQLGAEPNQFYSGVGFQVAEYVTPQFQVTVQTNKPEYINGDTINVDVNATYFFGGGVGNAALTWRLLSDDYYFQPSTLQGYWDFTDADLIASRLEQGGVIREGKGTLDASGHFHFQVPADLKDFPLSQNFTIEAQVTDINNQAVSSRVVVPVHKGNFYIGLRPERYIGTVGQPAAVDAITVDTKGVTVTNQTVALSFYEHKWYNVQVKQSDGSLLWQSAYTDTLVSQVNVTTDANGFAVARFTPPIGGEYKIVGDGKDAAGNAIHSATYLWVSSQQFVNWRIDNNDRIELVADKKQYAPGDTATVLIPAPFANADALLTIERGTIMEVRHLTLQGNSARVQIPIGPNYAPNVFVSVMLVKGRGADSPLPQFKLGYTNLSVSTVQKQLQITLTPNKRTHYAPGETATFSIQANDYLGKPAQAEFSVALVDKAVQSLVSDQSQSPLDAFYGQRGIGVTTAASLARSVERVNLTLTPGVKGGGGGGPNLQPVRRNFVDTAFWNANVVTDASGRAQVSIPLPDNLTTWNLTAKGVTVATQVGMASADIVSTKDLLVRPVTPRFFVVGDQAHLEAVVNNNTDQDISANVSLDAQGLSLSGNAQQPLTIHAHSAAKVGWDTTVNPVDQVVVKFSVSGGNLQDAVEQTLPVERPTSVETVATAGQVDTKTAEQIQLPSGIDTSAGNLQIELDPSLAAVSLNGLNYLKAYPYASTEETVSQFFPNVATYQALKQLGIARPDLKSQLETNISSAVQRLYSLQNGDGGWGWWANDASTPTLTAYALLGLYNAQQAGFAVDQNVMDRAVQYLTRYLNQPLDVKQGYAYNERAFVVFVLGEMGRVDNSRAVALYDQRANLSNYGKAFLLMTLLRLKQPQAQTLQSDLASAAVQSASGMHWEEAHTDFWTMNTNTRTTALVILALSRAGQGTPSATLSSAVRWLMAARIQNHWATTQETAWAVLALTQFMQSTGELQGNYTYQATLNGKSIGDGSVTPSNIDQPKTLSVAIKDLVQNAANDLVITRSAGPGRLYYSAYLNYYLPVQNIPALNRGILVARQYEAVDPATLKPTGQIIQSAKVGDYVQVVLTLIAPTDLNYLALEDRLPAGFEAVDTTLQTSSAAAQSPQLQKQLTPAEQQQQQQSPFYRFFQPYWSYWAHSEIRDDRVALFSTFLPRGTYEYTYLMRASVAGQFRTLPARAWETYFPDVFGRSAGTTFAVTQP